MKIVIRLFTGIGDIHIEGKYNDLDKMLMAANKIIKEVRISEKASS